MGYNSISIIVPVYKAEKYIDNCIKSVMNQSISDWNLILVDDGSPDNSGSICDKYAQEDSRICVIHQKNGGPGNARNAGIDICKTRWFTFVDADDKLESNFLENFHVESTYNDSDFSVQGFKRVDLKGNELGEAFDFSGATYEGDDFVESAFTNDNLYSYGQSFGKLYNKKICDENNIRVSKEINWSEDHLFYLEYILHVNKIITHPGKLYLYQFAEGESTLTHRPLPYKEALKMFHLIHNAADAVIDKFALRSPWVMSKINYHSITAGFSLVIKNLYREETDTTIRKSILGILKNDMSLMHKRFNPNSIKGKFLKYALLYMPTSSLDILLKTITK